MHSVRHQLLFLIFNQCSCILCIALSPRSSFGKGLEWGTISACKNIGNSRRALYFPLPSSLPFTLVPYSELAEPWNWARVSSTEPVKRGSCGRSWLLM